MNEKSSNGRNSSSSSSSSSSSRGGDSSGKHGEDKLDILFSKQNELFKKQLKNTAAVNKMKNLYEVKEPFDGYRIFMLSTALLHEAVELQRETNWKWWKSETKMNNDKIQEEIIDIWHFLIQVSIEAGIDPKTLVEKYLDKNKENLKRQETGY